MSRVAQALSFALLLEGGQELELIHFRDLPMCFSAIPPPALQRALSSAAHVVASTRELTNQADSRSASSTSIERDLQPQ